MRYTTLLFDLDHTLFDFDTSEAEAFTAALSDAGVEVGDRYHEQFVSINRALWRQVEAGELTPNDVRVVRFERLFGEVGVEADAHRVADDYLVGLGAYGDLYPGARDLLDELSAVASLALVSNGIGQVVRDKVARLDVDRYFDAIVISGEIGVAKPHPGFFDIAFERLGHPDKATTLMIGDSLPSDIRGGADYGIDTDPSGKQRSKTFKRQVDAKAFMDDVETDKRRGTYVDPQAGQVLVRVYTSRWMAARADKAAATTDRDASYLRSLILPTFGDRAVVSIRTSEVETWLATLDRADSTRSKALQILRSVLALAVRDRAVVTNATVGVKSPGSEPERTGKALTDVEVAALLDAAEIVDESTAGIVWLLARCGLRIGEALALHRSDVDLTTGTLTVSKSMNRRGDIVAVKGRKRADQGRTIPMPRDLSRRLGRHLAESTIASIDGLMFAAPRGGPVRYTSWRQRRWLPIMTLARVDANPHDLRHTTATRLIQVDRWGPSEVQAFLGHSDPRVALKIYTHVTSDDVPTPSTLTSPA